MPQREPLEPKDAPGGQAPGEEVTQVNDPYRGGEPPNGKEPGPPDEQHPTGG